MFREIPEYSRFSRFVATLYTKAHIVMPVFLLLPFLQQIKFCLSFIPCSALFLTKCVQRLSYAQTRKGRGRLTPHCKILYTQMSPKVNFWKLLEHDFLQARCPSCRQINSIAKLKGCYMLGKNYNFAHFNNTHQIHVLTKKRQR